jgi:hypothetical protein
VAASEGLGRLIGGHLDTVSFVMDYVEFRIDYNVLRALNPPRIELHDGTTASFPEQGSRDALCQLIDTEVADARVMHDDDEPRIQIRTSRGDLLSISLVDTGFSRVGASCSRRRDRSTARRGHAHLVSAGFCFEFICPLRGLARARQSCVAGPFVRNIVKLCCQANAEVGSRTVMPLPVDRSMLRRVGCAALGRKWLAPVGRAQRPQVLCPAATG